MMVGGQREWAANANGPPMMVGGPQFGGSKIRPNFRKRTLVETGLLGLGNCVGYMNVFKSPTVLDLSRPLCCSEGVRAALPLPRCKHTRVVGPPEGHLRAVAKN